jgi:formylglycine-generating enzyme required for sulfatase activity
MQRAILFLALMQLHAQDIHFVKISSGEFMMGCERKELVSVPGGMSACPSDELPRHLVKITKSFEMGAYELTQSQWQVIMGSNPSFFKGPERPVEQVTWDDAQEFINRLNARRDGYHYRLPTEAEWEYAAAAGARGPFAGPDLDSMAWYDITGKRGPIPMTESEGDTQPVGKKKPNAWGLYDMLGNVAEWVQDWYGATYYKSSSQADPTGPSESDNGAGAPYHVTRGGSWHSNPTYLRVSDRYQTVNVLRRRDTGFRLVREPN